jgi:hypothetical protein
LVIDWLVAEKELVTKIHKRVKIYSAIAVDKITVSLAASRIAGSEKRQAEFSDKLRSGWPTATLTVGVASTC